MFLGVLSLSIGLVLMCLATVGIIRIDNKLFCAQVSGVTDSCASALIVIGVSLIGSFSILSIKLLLVGLVLVIACSVSTSMLVNIAYLSSGREKLEGIEKEEVR